MVLWFDDINKNDIAAVGGKGANLGEMMRVGFPVPPGFCITTEAYRSHIQDLGLQLLIEKASLSAQRENVQELNELSAVIRGKIENAEISTMAENAIRKAYGELARKGTQLVAVRSSATAEDLPNFSFAGQQETFLSVCGEDQVLEYVKKCWASLWAPRSIAYRQKNGFAHEQVLLSVVVQAMVQPEVSGVLFTVDPLSGSLDEMMVNASYGLGESIVSGKVTPDAFRISKHGGQLITEKTLGSKETRIDSGPDGMTIETDTPDELRSRFCLEEPELKSLLDLGLRVEAHYNSPQDIEWAIAEGKLYLLQTRPVTTTPAIKGKNHQLKIKKMSRIQQKLLDNYKEHIPDAPYPLDYEPLLLLNRQKNAVIHELGITMPAENKIVKMDEHGVLSVGRLLAHPNFHIIRMPFILAQMKRLSQSGETADTIAQLKHVLEGLQNTDICRLDNQTLYEYIWLSVDNAIQWTYLRFRVYVFPMIFLGFSINRTIRKAKFSKPVNQYDFLAGLDYKTAEIEHALYSLAKELDEDTGVRQLFLEKESREILPVLKEKYAMYFTKIAGFLKEYGARTMKVNIPFSAQSWSERPELLIDTLITILKAGNLREHIEQQKNSGKKYADLKNAVSGKLTPEKRKRFERLLEQFRSAHTGREALIYYIEQSYVAARHGVAEAAERLRMAGLISLTEDIRYLTLSELKQALSGESSANALESALADRKAHRCMAEQAWNGSAKDIAIKGNVLQGMSGSPGLVKGTVRIINGPDEFGRLQKGDVLVCHFTDPVWTPLFPAACAVVCDTGGPLSHAAIVAREYGIPAVLGTKNSTSVLKDGQVVTVDGSKGIVLLHSQH